MRHSFIVKGIDPASSSVQVQAQRRQELVAEFTGSDPEIERSLKTMYQQEGHVVASRGALDRAVFSLYGQGDRTIKIITVTQTLCFLFLCVLCVLERLFFINQIGLLSQL